ncbi:hypothetical protein MtrunA17_Chr1g0178921 [Medicago truncatula]|uniref:Uncharacterized protein n=1 Tax=Medicago truncatula TaxID=3880 RepID=A0A072VVC4_MEDTR|nr:hypothetical protein MTR_1g060470 [Medicago truncatula]RHN79581.1 hypothetical protein MtrunA17_Chr1g0178921 [Medicago truncatula]
MKVNETRPVSKHIISNIQSSLCPLFLLLLRQHHHHTTQRHLLRRHCFSQTATSSPHSAAPPPQPCHSTRSSPVDSPIDQNPAQPQLLPKVFITTNRIFDHPCYLVVIHEPHYESFFLF